MPTYQDPANGVSISEGYLEAAYAAPADRMMINCFEFYHPIGTPDGPIYAANDGQPFSAFIESTADRNASNEVEFMASYIRLERPEESDSEGSPELALSVDNVSSVLSDALRLVRLAGSIEPWEVIERVYATDDPSAPAILPPMRMLLTNVDLDAETAQFRASFGDPGNVAIPRTTFKRAEYPGLVR